MQYRMYLALVALVAVALLVGTAGVAQADLIAHWAFDETSDTTAYDSTGNHNGTIDTTSGYGPTIDQAGKFGRSYLFNGATSHGVKEGGVEVPYSSELEGIPKLSLCQWVYMTDDTITGNPRRIINNSYGSSDPGKSYASWQWQSLKWGGGFGGPTNAGHVKISSTNFGALENWHQLTITWDGSAYDADNTNPYEANLYLDGVLESTLTGDSHGIYPNGLGVMLGTGFRTTDKVFDGQLDDLGIWDEPLTDGKAIALYNTPNVSGLEAYNLSYMEKLFDVYDNDTPDTIGGLIWEREDNFPGGHSDGDAWSDGSYYYVQLETGGSVEINTAMGVKGVIPEPSTLLLLATGLLGLLAYAWRKRK